MMRNPSGGCRGKVRGFKRGPDVERHRSRLRAAGRRHRDNTPRQATPENGARRGGPAGKGGEEPPHPEVAAPRHRPQHLHRIPLVPEGVPGGGHPRNQEGHCGPGPRRPLHRPWPVRRRVPGPGHQAGHGHQRARHRPPRGGRGLRVEPARRLRGGRAGGHGAVAQRDPPGPARGQAARRHPSQGGTRGRDRRRGHRGSRRRGPGHGLRVEGGRPDLPPPRAGDLGRHDVPLPTAEGRHDRTGHRAGLRQDREERHHRRRSCSRPGPRPSRRPR